jgi:peptidoglycan/LPS O-acetylase OafA/YrhL
MEAMSAIVEVPKKPSYIPTLDGWRALAIFAVIFYHDKLHRLGPFTDAPLRHFGFLGVDLFFAISGLLICSRLLEEEHQHHRIRLKEFYARRFCRILPAAIVFLGIIACLSLGHMVHVGLNSWLSSLLFFRNYYTAMVRDSDPSIYTNHFWSLSVEEHFYLLFPVILVFCGRSRTKVLGVFVVVSLVYDLCVHALPMVLNAMGGDYANVRTELHVVSLFFPALLAVLLAKPEIRNRCQRWFRPWSTILGFVTLWVLTHFLAHMLAVQLLVPLGFPLIILSTILHPKSLLGRFLELRPLRFLGRISYSLYLWQQLFFIGDHQPALSLLGRLQNWPANLLATILCAIGSYCLIERPFIRLGHRLAPPATEGREGRSIGIESSHRAWDRVRSEPAA